MNNRLVWIAVVALGVSAACALTVLASATAFVGSVPLTWRGATRGCGAASWAKKIAPSTDSTRASKPRTVDLDWHGSDAVRVNIPARIRYRPGAEAQASVSGDAELINHVRMQGGTLEWDSVDDCFAADDLVVQLSGPAVSAWTLNGSGELDLSDIKQDVLDITMHGSGSVNASGEVRETSLVAAGSGRADLNIKQDRLRVTMHGSGNVTASGEAHEASLQSTGSGSADLSRLVAQQVSARISGSAEADLAPRDDADISITGSGIVRLHGAGARIHSHVSGSGQIKQLP